MNGHPYQEQLREILDNNEQARNLVLENLLEQVVFLDLEMRIIWANARVIERHSLQSVSYLGRKCFEVYHQLSEPCTDCPVVEVIKTGRAHSGVHRSPDGCFWKVTGTPVRNKKGELIGVLDTALEISELKEAENALRESEARFRLIAEEAPVGICISDRDQRTLYLNRKFIDLFGYTLADIPSVEAWWPLAYPDQALRSRIRREWHAAVAEASRNQVEIKPMQYPVTCKDGSIKEIEFRLASRGGMNVVLFTDITERKMMVEELRNSERNYREIFNAGKDAIFIQDSITGAVVDVNDAAVKMYECEDKDELISGKIETYSDIDTGYSRERIMEMIRSVLKSGKESFEWRARTKSGRPFWVEVSLKLVRIGEAERILAVVRDITERKQIDDRIRYISFHDSLTGLYNRAYLEEEMQRLDTSRQYPLSIVIADLNGLKLVNDTYGHSAGDDMLKAAAKVFRESCRADDIIARWGGDEFVVLLPQTSVPEAEQICERIRDGCRNAYVSDVPVSMALGTKSKEDHKKELTAVLREAEDHMYRQKLTESRSIKSAVLKALLKTLEEKSYETEIHTRRMQKAAAQIGRDLGLSDAEQHRLNLLITLHDIGKINIAEEVLTKKGPLSAEEWAVIRKHPETGFRIARATEDFAHVAEDILAHHERWDGAGYPQGLKGKEIPLLARITAIADAYEVMSNGRPYKKKLGRDEIVSEFKKNAGRQFDPDLVIVFLNILKSGFKL